MGGLGVKVVASGDGKEPSKDAWLHVEAEFEHDANINMIAKEKIKGEDNFIFAVPVKYA